MDMFPAHNPLAEFARILSGDNPVAEFARIPSGDNPVAEFARIPSGGAQGDCQNGREVRSPSCPCQLPLQPDQVAPIQVHLSKRSCRIWRVHLPAMAAMLKPMSEVTQILAAVERGDPQAAEQLLPLVYDELRKLAAQRLAGEKPGQTLQPTALVHDAYLRLVDVEQAQRWNGRGHFFAAAAEAMRRILVENARRKMRVRHGGGRKRLTLADLDLVVEPPDEDLLALDEVLGRLDAEHPEVAAVVKLRYFAGMTAAQAADALNLSLRTANRHWAFARAWLFDALGSADAV